MHHDSHCRSLLDPHPKNSLDWLKCLMQSSHHQATTANGKEQGHSKKLIKKSLRMMFATHVDFDLAGEAVSRRTESHGTGHHSLEVEDFAATNRIMMASGSCCGESYRLQQPATPSAISNSCFVLRSVDHAGAAQGGEGLTSHDASTSPCDRFSSTASKATAARPAPIVSASMAASAVAAVAAHSASETETGPVSPLAGEQPTAPAQSARQKSESGHGTHSGSARSSMAAAPSASSNSQRPVSATTAVSPSSSPSCTPPPSHVHLHTSTGNSLTSTHTNSDHATPSQTNTDGGSVPSPCSTDTNNHTSISTSTSASTSTSTSTPTSPSHHSVLILLSSSAFLHSALEMTQKGLSRSKDATTAFLYRTFSPTYRICRLYVDSWNNGTQRRGLDRIKTSVVRGDAFTLVRNTTMQMQDVWRRVMVAYSIKAASARAKVVSMASGSAAWRAKRTDDHRGVAETGNARNSSGSDNNSGSGGGSGDGNNISNHNNHKSHTGVKTDEDHNSTNKKGTEKDRRGPDSGSGSRTRR
ncbi:unnamed protein product [Mortierella alpina]